MKNAISYMTVFKINYVDLIWLTTALAILYNFQTEWWKWFAFAWPIGGDLTTGFLRGYAGLRKQPAGLEITRRDIALRG